MSALRPLRAAILELLQLRRRAGLHALSQVLRATWQVARAVACCMPHSVLLALRVINCPVSVHTTCRVHARCLCHSSATKQHQISMLGAGNFCAKHWGVHAVHLWGEPACQNGVRSVEHVLLSCDMRWYR